MTTQRRTKTDVEILKLLQSGPHTITSLEGILRCHRSTIYRSLARLTEAGEANQTWVTPDDNDPQRAYRVWTKGKA